MEKNIINSKKSEKNSDVINDIFSVFAQHPFITFALMTICSACIFISSNDTDLSTFSLFSIFSVYTILSAIFLFFVVKNYFKDKLSQYSIFCINITLSLIIIIFSANITNNIISVFIFAFIVSVIFLCFLIIEDKLNTKYLSAIIIFLGFSLRLTYILYTTIYERQHDNYSLGGIYGHLGYITHFWNNLFSLPEGDVREISQYYHPPLHHFLVGIMLDLLKSLGYNDIQQVGEYIQYLTMFYSSICMILFYKIMRFFKIDGVPLLLGVSVIAFHPTMLILGGSVNNDILSITFMLGAILNTLYYYRKHTYSNIIKVGACVGFAMMSKLSGWMVAPAIAVVFIIVIIQKKEKWFDIFKQWIAFGIVCVPLGLWWSVRNLIKFDVPLGYVMRLSEKLDMYLGNDYTAFQRLTDFSSFQFESVYDQYKWYHCPYYEYNPTIGLFKTSLFDEAQYGTELNFWATSLFWINILLALVAIIAMIYILINKNRFIDITMKIFLFLLYIVPTVSYYIFCIEYPFTCTMNIRYNVTSIFIGMLFLSFMVQSLQDNYKSNKNDKDKILIIDNVIFICCSVLITVFCLLSVITYLKIGYIPAVYDGVVLK